MKNCIKCKAEISETSSYCEHCGTNQIKDEILERIDLLESRVTATVKSENTSLLVLLCVLTIIASVFGIARGILYEAISSIADHDYSRGWLYALANFGSLLGAIIMLTRNKTGLYIYTIGQSIYVLTVIYSATLYKMHELAGAFSLFFILPSIVFVVLYWTPGIRNKLA